MSCRWRAIGVEHRDPAAMGIGHPDRAVARDLEAVRHAACAHAGELAPCADRAVRRHVVDPDQGRARVGMIEALAVGRKAQAVGQHDAVGQRAHRAIEIDDMKVARLGRLAAEDAEGERADIDAALRVGREIVEAGGAGDGVQGEQRPRRAVGQARRRDVASADHQPARRMQRHAADAAPLGDGRGDRVRRDRAGRCRR